MSAGRAPPDCAALELLSTSCTFLPGTKPGNGAESAEILCQQSHRWSLSEHRGFASHLPRGSETEMLQLQEALAFHSGHHMSSANTDGKGSAAFLL